jgi:ABC-2 type transport system ATP-binding protein
VGGDRLDIRLEDPSRCSEALAMLRPLAGGDATLDDGVLQLPLSERRGAIAEAVRRLDEAGVGIDDIAVRRPTLDDVFLRLTGHAAEDEEAEAEVEAR